MNIELRERGDSDGEKNRANIFYKQPILQKITSRYKKNRKEIFFKNAVNVYSVFSCDIHSTLYVFGNGLIKKEVCL